jgi:hypothetical protein
MLVSLNARPVNSGVRRLSHREDFYFMKSQHLFVSIAIIALLFIGTANGQDSCRYWSSRVDSTVSLPDNFERLDEKDSQNIMAGIRCLLQLEGNHNKARFSGATRFDTSQTFSSQTVDVAALFYISYLYYQDWGAFSGAVALRGDGGIDKPSATRKAYKYYREWFKEVEKIGIVEARKKQLAPLKDKDISWY